MGFRMSKYWAVASCSASVLRLCVDGVTTEQGRHVNYSLPSSTRAVLPRWTRVRRLPSKTSNSITESELCACSSLADVCFEPAYEACRRRWLYWCRWLYWAVLYRAGLGRVPAASMHPASNVRPINSQPIANHHRAHARHGRTSPCHDVCRSFDSSGSASFSIYPSICGAAAALRPCGSDQRLQPIERQTDSTN